MTVEDSYGNTGSDQITIEVVAGDGIPTAEIGFPLNNTSIGKGQHIALIAKYASDPVDGYLDGSNVKWSSDIDGPLGEGRAIAVVLSGPEQCGVASDAGVRHTITLEVKDSDGNTARDSIVVTVFLLC